MNGKPRVSALQVGRTDGLAVDGSVAIEFSSAGTSTDGKSRSPARESGKCRISVLARLGNGRLETP